MKLTVVEGFRLTEIAAWAQLHLGKGTRVVSDGLACFHGVTAAGCVHEPVVVGSGRAAVERPEFRWVNTILGNIKNALRGTSMRFVPSNAQRYLSEPIVGRLTSSPRHVALRTPPTGTATHSLSGSQETLYPVPPRRACERKTTPHVIHSTGLISTRRAWLGHVSLNTTNIYAEIDIETKARAMALCDAATLESSRPWKEDKGLIAFLKSL